MTGLCVGVTKLAKQSCTTRDAKPRQTYHYNDLDVFPKNKLKMVTNL